MSLMDTAALSKAKSISISLKWRIVAVLLFAALLPLALTGFGSWIVFGNLLEQKALEQMRALVESHADAVESHLSERRHLLELSAESFTLDELVKPGRLQQLFTDLNRVSDDGFVDLGVIDSGGKHLVYVGPYDLQGLNYRNADWFKEVKLGGEYISDVFLGFRGIPHCIIAVKSSEAARSWILRATINGVQFDAIVKAESLGKGSDAYIVNRGGYYQTTPRNGALLDRAADTLITPYPGVTGTR